MTCHLELKKIGGTACCNLSSICPHTYKTLVVFLDWLRPCVDSIIQGFSRPVMKVSNLDTIHLINKFYYSRLVFFDRMSSTKGKLKNSCIPYKSLIQNGYIYSIYSQNSISIKLVIYCIVTGQSSTWIMFPLELIMTLYSSHRVIILLERACLHKVFSTRMCNVTAWRHSKLRAHWGGVWGRSMYSAFPWSCSVSYLSFVWGRSLTAGKILFTGRQTCSLYLCGSSVTLDVSASACSPTRQ